MLEFLYNFHKYKKKTKDKKKQNGSLVHVYGFVYVTCILRLNVIYQT